MQLEMITMAYEKSKTKQINMAITFSTLREKHMTWLTSLQEVHYKFPINLLRSV